MYTDQLDEQTLAFNDIFLDPNNPRFWTEKTVRDIPDNRIPDPRIQDRTLDSISAHGISELRDSIVRNGFLPLDRIVVRPLFENPKQFVIVEGKGLIYESDQGAAPALRRGTSVRIWSLDRL